MKIKEAKIMWSRNNNYRHQRYSIGEKIKYYEKYINEV